MTNKEFLEHIASKNGRTPKDVDNLLKSLASVVSECLYEGSEVTFPGLGTFIAKVHDEHIEIDSTGKKILFPPEVKISFQCANTLINRMNEEKQ